MYQSQTKFSLLQMQSGWGGGCVCVRRLSQHFSSLPLFIFSSSYFFVYGTRPCLLWHLEGLAWPCVFVCLFVVFSSCPTFFYFSSPSVETETPRRRRQLESRVPPEKSPRLICEPFFFVALYLRVTMSFFAFVIGAQNNRLLSSFVVDDLRRTQTVVRLTSWSLWEVRSLRAYQHFKRRIVYDVLRSLPREASARMCVCVGAGMKACVCVKE